MKGLLVIVTKEWHSFTGSDRGVFILYLFLVTSWSLMLAAPHKVTTPNGSLWLMFFSVIISANFSNTVFIGERINGILEILITSGLTRRQILFGKMLFTGGMSSIIGLLCSGLSLLWKQLMYSDGTYTVGTGDVLVYLAAVYFNTASAAYLSVKLVNPRHLHLVNMFLLAVIAVVHMVASSYFGVPDFILPVMLVIFASLLTAVSIKVYDSEKIVQSVTV